MNLNVWFDTKSRRVLSLRLHSRSRSRGRHESDSRRGHYDQHGRHGRGGRGSRNGHHGRHGEQFAIIIANHCKHIERHKYDTNLSTSLYDRGPMALVV